MSVRWTEHEYEMALLYAEQFGTPDAVYVVLKRRVADLAEMEVENRSLRDEVDDLTKKDEEWADLYASLDKQYEKARKDSCGCIP